MMQNNLPNHGNLWNYLWSTTGLSVCVLQFVVLFWREAIPEIANCFHQRKQIVVVCGSAERDRDQIHKPTSSSSFIYFQTFPSQWSGNWSWRLTMQVQYRIEPTWASEKNFAVISLNYPSAETSVAFSVSPGSLHLWIPPLPFCCSLS